MKDIRFNRERFLKGNTFYGDKGINAQTAQLRIEVPFVAGKGAYDFDLKKEVKRVTEKTLKRNDLFVARALGFGLMVETTAKPGHAPILSYPLLAGDGVPAGINGFVNTDAYAVYNGIMSMKTGQVVNYSGFPMSTFLNIPETQPVAIVDDAGAMASAGILPQFNMDQILYELPEEIVLAGTQDHKIQVEFPAIATTDIKGGEGTTSYLVLVIEGWLFEGGTSEDYKRDSRNPYRTAI